MLYSYLPSGFSGRLIPPVTSSRISWQWKPYGCIIRYGERPASLSARFTTAMISRLVVGSNWQFTPTMSAPGGKWNSHIVKTNNCLVGLVYLKNPERIGDRISDLFQCHASLCLYTLFVFLCYLSYKLTIFRHDCFKNTNSI